MGDHRSVAAAITCCEQMEAVGEGSTSEAPRLEWGTESGSSAAPRARGRASGSRARTHPSHLEVKQVAGDPEPGAEAAQWECGTVPDRGRCGAALPRRPAARLTEDVPRKAGPSPAASDGGAGTAHGVPAWIACFGRAERSGMGPRVRRQQRPPWVVGDSAKGFPQPCPRPRIASASSRDLNPRLRKEAPPTPR